jgi:hypothetical protein
MALKVEIFEQADGVPFDRLTHIMLVTEMGFAREQMTKTLFITNAGDAEAIQAANAKVAEISGHQNVCHVQVVAVKVPKVFEFSSLPA